MAKKQYSAKLFGADKNWLQSEKQKTGRPHHWILRDAIAAYKKSIGDSSVSDNKKR
jgi:predicted DNA-binding protein